MKLWEKLKAYREKKGLPWFTEPWDLNLFILRSGRVGEWDDLWFLTCVDDSNRRIVQRVKATSDAWAGEWTNPTHPDGTVFILNGHYPGGYERGLHKGRICLRQRVNFEYVRWPANGQIPTVAQLNSLAASGKSFWDNRGTHIHNRISGKAPAKPQRDDSEGCVVSLWYHQHMAGIELVKQQERFRGSSIVSPTFLRAEDLD